MYIVYYLPDLFGIHPETHYQNNGILCWLKMLHRERGKSRKPNLHGRIQLATSAIML